MKSGGCALETQRVVFTFFSSIQIPPYLFHAFTFFLSTLSFIHLFVSSISLHLRRRAPFLMDLFVPSASVSRPLHDPSIIDYFFSGFELLLIPSNAEVAEAGRSIPFALFDAEYLTALCELASYHFRSQPIVLRLDSSVMIVGDLHGSIHDLLRILRIHGLNRNYLFLGDYVDRGQFSIECITLLFTLTLKFPDRFRLLRGNHETIDVASKYGFLAEISGHYPVSVFDCFCEAFSWMPLAAIVQNRYFCVHGGIGPSFHSISEVEALERPIISDSINPIITDLLWADPSDHCSRFSESVARGKGGLYGSLAVQAFLEENGLETIVRAHECVDGVHKMSMPVITVFSASNYRLTEPNQSGVLLINEDNAPRRYRYPAFQKLMRRNAFFVPASPPQRVSKTPDPTVEPREGVGRPQRAQFQVHARRLSNVLPLLRVSRTSTLVPSVRSSFNEKLIGRCKAAVSFVDLPSLLPESCDSP
jgi:diadenosine tetraphosphatase ApaH/serine/threonine PP2A family protein phosphatase